jgi:hypothetical protein
VQGGRLIAAVVLATLAFIAYSRTLLPSVDPGDTGGFQAAVLWPETTARQAYPLYYGLATPFVKLVSPANPARGLNLFSAVCAAAAVGLLSWVVAAVTGSLVGSIAGGLLLAFSYTFWTQAVIAEVYTLHLALVGCCLLALLAFSKRPTRARLALFCAVYALSFGNHFSMILLFVPFAAFVFMTHPRPRDLVHPRIIMMAAGIAAAGALQYLPNLLALWSSVDAPPAWRDRLAAFWFDVTKADWRASMVLGIEGSAARDRMAMWVWDARQQFGLIGLAFAASGAIRLWWISRPWAVLVWLAYAMTTMFAVTYNVGDPHVFFLPGHLLTALLAGVGAAVLVSVTGKSPSDGRVRRHATRAAACAVSIAVILYGGWRGWETWPAADRHRDARADDLVSRTMLGVDEQKALLVSNMNWEQENALRYAGRYMRPDVAWVRLPDVFPHFPFLVQDNLRIGRDVVLTAEAAAAVVSAYGATFPLLPDEVPPAPVLSTLAARIPAGSPYVLSLLTPLAEYAFDREDLDRAVALMTGGQTALDGSASYEIVAGLSGEAPAVHRTARRPFRERISLLGDELDIRMDAWLPADTFRRGGFGHVVRGREPVLIIERGVSLVWFDRDGSPVTAYAAGLYAPRPRFRISPVESRLASAGPVRGAVAGRIQQVPASHLPTGTAALRDRMVW